MTCHKQFVITDTNVTPAMLSGMSAEEQTNIIQSIADIVEIIGSVVAIAEQLHTLLADCGGTTTASDKNIRDGFQTASGDKKIGYVMVQKGKTFDFANKTQTKIKGKAKIWKKKSNGNWKKDRKTRVGINFCAKEQNECAGGEWPSDPSFYQSPTPERRKKVKIKHFEPKALSIQLSTHFLQFKYFKAGGFEKALNLLGSTGCQ